MPGCLETNLNTIPWCSKELPPSYKTCFQHFQPIHNVIWSEYFRLPHNSVWFWATCHNSITCFFLRFGGPYQTIINDHQIGFKVIWAIHRKTQPLSRSLSPSLPQKQRSCDLSRAMFSFVDDDQQTKNANIWKLWKVKALFGMATCPQKKRHFAVQHKTFIRKYKADPGCWGQDQQCYGRAQGEGRNGWMSPVLWPV